MSPSSSRAPSAQVLHPQEDYLRSAWRQVTVRWKGRRESGRDEKAIQVKEDSHHHKVPHLDAAEALVCVCTPVLAGLRFRALSLPCWLQRARVCAWPWLGLYFTLQSINPFACSRFNFACSPFHLFIQGLQSVSFPFKIWKFFFLLQARHPLWPSHARASLGTAATMASGKGVSKA